MILYFLLYAATQLMHQLTEPSRATKTIQLGIVSLGQQQLLRLYVDTLVLESGVES